MQKKYALAINGVRGMVEAQAETHQSSERTVLLVLEQTEQHKDICGPLLMKIMLRMQTDWQAADKCATGANFYNRKLTKLK